jgi:hypothetical protein
MWQWSWVVLCLLLAGCGGSGGGDSNSPSNSGRLSLAFQPASLSATNYAGEASGLDVAATTSVIGNVAATQINVAVIDRHGVLQPQIDITQLNGTTYRAMMTTSANLSPGTYTGSLEVRMCEDDPTVCARPVNGSPWQLPYAFTVRPNIDLHDLAPLPGARDWSMFQGDAQRNAQVSAQLAPATFSRRFALPDPELGTDTSISAVGHGLAYFTSRGPTAQSPLTLHAVRESDGTTAWSRPIGTVNHRASPPMVDQGRVHVFTTHDTTTLWSFDAVSGDPRGESDHAPFSADGTPAARDGKLYACRSGNLVRIDAASHAVDWLAALPAFTTSCTSAVDASRAFVFDGGALQVIDIASQAHAYTVPTAAMGVSGSRQAPVVGPNNRVYMNGTTVLSAYDLTSRTVAWEVTGSFASNPVIVGDTLYIATDRSLQARSAITGQELWRWTTTGSTVLGDVESALLVTASHAIVASSWETVAIDLQTHSLAWRDSFGGALALSANGALWVRPAFGKGLRAINLH